MEVQTTASPSLGCEATQRGQVTLGRVGIACCGVIESRCRRREGPSNNAPNLLPWVGGPWPDVPEGTGTLRVSLWLRPIALLHATCLWSILPSHIFPPLTVSVLDCIF